MSRKVEMSLSELLDWLSTDELAYEFPVWCKKKFNITKEDIQNTVEEWKKKDSLFDKEDVDALCDKLGIKE